MTNNQKDSPNINKNIHPPFVALFYLIMGILLQRFLPIPIQISPILQNAGFGLIFLGFLCGVGAFLEFRKARTTLDPHGSVKVLVTNGIYRFTRNPIYLGFLFMVLGFPLNYGSLWGIIIAPFFIITINRMVIEKEETYLEKKFGEAYTSYKSKVRRWL
ncbi:MAG: isoprenylcysteine carboxylmethyltransferase family protein [Anaerolineales bacterium]